MASLRRREPSGGDGRRGETKGENEIRLGGSATATADPTSQPEMKVEDGKRDNSWCIIAPIECTYFHCVLIQKMFRVLSKYFKL